MLYPRPLILFRLILLFGSLSIAAEIISAAPGADLNEDQRYFQAIQWFNQKNWDEAQRALHDFLAHFPRSRWQYAARLRLADLETNPSQALKQYEQVISEAKDTEWAQDARWALATSFFSLGRYSEAREHLNVINSSSGLRQDASLYLAALCSAALKDYPAARSLYQLLLEKFPKSPWAAWALVGLGDVELSCQKNTAALQAFERYQREYPEGDLLDRVLMQKSKLLSTEGLADESNRLLQELITRFPDSFITEKARGRLVKVQSKYTIQVGAFTKHAYAQKLEKTLRKKGYNAYQIEARSGDEVFYQVRVGSYISRELADKIGEKLAQKEKLPYVILTYIKPETSSTSAPKP